MTPPIRWIEREEVHSLADMGDAYVMVRILQYKTDTGEWVDVPVVGDGG